MSGPLTISLDDAVRPIAGSEKTAVQEAPRTLSLDEAIKPAAATGGREAPPEGKKSVPDYLRPAVGINRGLADLAGAPVDAATWVINHSPGTWAVNKGAEALGFKAPIPEIKEPFGGSGTFKKAMGLVGANPDDVAPPTTSAQRILEGAGEGAANMLLPGLGADAVLGKAGNSFIAAALDMIKGSGPISNAVMGAASGAGSEIAQEHAPDAMKPTAALLGALGGGAIGGGLVAGAEGAGRAIQGAYRAVSEPANLRAARTIEGAAQNPDQFREDLQTAAAKPDEVAGAPLTTFQATGDKGVGGMESELQQRYRSEFTDRKEQQNTARIAAITENTAPEAVSADVANYVKGKLSEIDAEHGVLSEEARRADAEKLAATGGTEHGTLSGYGADLQKRMDELDDIKHEKESALWALVDRDKDLKINPTPLRNAAIADEKAMPRTAEPIDGKELGILNTAKNLAPDTTFDELTTLRSRITDEIRNARKDGQGQTARRLNGLLGHVDDTLAGTMGDVAADPAQRSDLIKELLAVNEKWQAQRDEVAGVLNKRTGTGPLSGEGNEGLGATGEGRISPAFGGGGEEAGQVGLVAGGEGVQGSLNGVPPDVAARYAAARAETKDRKTTFGGAVGAAIAPGPQYGSFRATATAVANGLIDKPERFNAFIKAADGDPQAMATIQDLAAFSMRKASVKDGMISPSRLDEWVASHKHVFDEYPELQAKFSDAKSARQTLDAALGAQKDALEAYENSAARHFLGDREPSVAIAQAIKSSEEFGQLVEMVKGNPAAFNGLKRAVGEFIAKKLIGNTEVGTSGENALRGGAFQQFLKESGQSLEKLFTPEEMENFGKVASNFRAAQRSDNALRTGGGSDTTQKIGPMMNTVFKQFIAKHGATVMATAGGLEAARHTGGMTGLALAAGGAATGAITDALITSRINTIEKAIVEQLLDRKLAAEWNAKIPTDNTVGFANTFARRMNAVVANQVMNAVEQEKRAP